MRRYAVVFAVSLAFAGWGACTGHLKLPADGTDGGSGMTGSGGRMGNSGGSFGTGGRVGGTGGRTAGTGGMLGTCAGARDQVPFQIKRAEVVLAVGRNSSMATLFGSTTRMLAAQQSIRSVVADHQTAVKFGYQDFPSAESCGGNTCCANYNQVVLPVLSNSSAIEKAMMHCDLLPAASGCVAQSASRPVADALLGVWMPPPNRMPLFFAQPGDDTDRRYVLMVDGAPQCNSAQEDLESSCKSAKAQMAQLLNTAKVRIHIVPIGTINDEAESSECLRDMALMGEPSSTSSQPFKYHGRDPKDLTTSLSMIADEAAEAACVITLLNVPNDRNVALEIADFPVPYDPSGLNGWSYATGSRGTMEVHGGWCDQIQQTRDRDVRVWACQ